MASNQTTLPNVSENEETLLTGVNENVYEDQNIGAELTKKDINRVAWRSMLLQASFNYERMQASGWLYGLLPALKKIHTNKRDLARAMKGHMGFFNTHPEDLCDFFLREVVILAHIAYTLIKIHTNCSLAI